MFPAGRFAAMANATVQLKDAVDRAITLASGRVAVAVAPDLTDGRLVARIALSNNEQLLSAMEPLD
jgi:hypothetical protein